MAHPARKFWPIALTIIVIAGLLSGVLVPFNTTAAAQSANQNGGETSDYIHGPFNSTTTSPTVYNGDLRDLPQTSTSQGGELPPPGSVKRPNQINGVPPAEWVDTVAQQSLAQGQMPEPIMNFEGLMKSEGGYWTPPDTDGDVGPDHYIQVVNNAVGIYDKVTGEALLKISYNDFFQGPNVYCDEQNRGDVVVLYDEQVDRWIVTDFSLPDNGPYFECIAVSQSGDPLEGGWYYYALQANTGYFSDAFNDYPKLGVWSDGWYMSANMFGNGFEGVRVWALDREAMINGLPLDEVHFDCIYDENSNCASLLPANVRGTLPPEGSPEYFANVIAPHVLNLWQFQVDWDEPGNSTFTGPFPLTVANFQMASSIPQKDTNQTLDSLGDRMMFQLQYRNIDGVESLYANHSVNSGGVVGIRWYEIRDPGGSPAIFQQGTYQPDNNYRWMGSIAADQEGNIAVGYSISSSDMYPAIRYAGRLAGEIPNLLTQNETELFQGPGSQTGTNRWGDYSAMSIDPVDGCTFWYTQEYATSGSNWHTRIGSFKFPSCGEPKGTIDGTVYNSVTNLPIAGVPLLVHGLSYDFNAVTDESGHFSTDLIAGSYDLTAGPLLPGYPGTASESGVEVVTGETTTVSLYLDPVPFLVHDSAYVADPYGNGNSFPEPGEQALELSEYLYNQGAITSTQVIARLSSLTDGVTVDTADTTYADIAAGESLENDTPYIFSIDPSVPCGTDLNFQALITDSVSTYSTAFSLNASVPLPRQDVFSNTVEAGDMGWTTGGYPNSWAITDLDSHSPTHSWTDSPAGDYQDNTNNFVRTPAFDLTGLRHVKLSGWFKYELESGWDYAYLEYSLDGGANWVGTPLATFNGFQDWSQLVIDAPMLDNQPNVAFRFHLISDGGVTEDGLYVDDVALSYEPFECSYAGTPDAPLLVSPENGSMVDSPVTFVWQPADEGEPTQGFIVYLDDSPVVTFTEPVTITILDVASGAHTWFVKATNEYGASEPSDTWNLEVPSVPNAPTLVSPLDGTWVNSPVTFVWEPAVDGAPPDGYVLFIDDTPAITFTEPITSTTLDISSWAHTWYVKATNASGTSLPSPTWSLNIFGEIFLPLTRK